MKVNMTAGSAAEALGGVPILLVDDNPAKISAIKAILDDLEQNLRIDTASSGLEALESLLQQEYALILLDVNMPGMSGFETAQAIRARRRSRTTPLIFVTADTAADAALYDGYALGAVDFVTAPIIPDLLLAKVRVFVSVWQMRADLLRANAALNKELGVKEQQASALESTNRELEKSRADLVEMTRQATLNEMAGEMARELAELIDTANAPIIGVDLHGRINEWNRAASRILGVSREQAIGQLLIERFVPQRGRERSFEKLALALAGTPIENYTVTLCGADDREVELMFNCSARRLTSGEICGVISVGQDLTELRMAQAQLIQASKLASLGEMSTGVAHELNQPLNIIRMAATNVVRALDAELELTPDYLREKLARIDKQTVRAAAIIDHMRMFGRIAKEEDEAIDVNEVVASSLEMVQEQMRLDEIEIGTELDERLAPVLGHAIPLEQVLINLLSNARDAYRDRTPAADAVKQVSIETRQEEAWVRIEVRDHAGGIPDELLDRIFEPFFTTKEVGLGTGLGLSVSYGIIRDMGGELSAENHADGASMIIRLPVHDVAGPVAESPAEQVSAG